MVDRVSSEARSRNMSLVGSRGNRSTEKALASALRRCHVRGWKRHQALPGTPDFSFAKERVAVFVDGCFWHRCPRCGQLPATRPQFWAQKLEANRLRDQRVGRALRRMGWSVIRVWEHCLRTPESQDRVAKRIRRKLAARSAQ